MSKKSDIQYQFEQWKIEESERIKSIQKQEITILIEKIRKEWITTSTKVQKSWNDKENQIDNAFNSLQNAINDYENIILEKKNLELQVKDLEQEIDLLRKPPNDDDKQERLIKINSLRLEIQKMEKELTDAETELREVTNSKNRYKRLFLQSTKTLKEMLNEKKK